MLVVGLTGGIAAGKSTVSERLKELGAEIIDADLLARELVNPGSVALQEIRQQFGESVLNKDGSLDRKKLGEMIFSKPELRAKLNSILHPKILTETRNRIEALKQKGQAPLILVDAPLLIESNMMNMVDEVWVVAVPPRMQLERLMNRDSLTLEQAKQRLESQLPLHEKIRYADRVIYNNESKEQTLKIIDKLWEEISRQ